MKQYLNLLNEIVGQRQYKKPARENMPGTYSLFGNQMRFGLNEGFPLLTTKKMFFKGVVVELLWFLRGDTNIKYLVDNGCNVWNQDAYNYYVRLYNKHSKSNCAMPYDEFIEYIKAGCLESSILEGQIGYRLGDMGYQYGKTWRRWQGYHHVPDVHRIAYGSVWIDQIGQLIKGLRDNPEGRRHLVTAVDPAHSGDLDVALFPCHAMFQFNCREIAYSDRLRWAQEKCALNGVPEGFFNTKDNSIPKYYLDCHLYQRSADAFLGVPFNIASYALLTHIIAECVGMVPGDFIHSFGDVHIYENHLDQVKEQLTRQPYDLCTLHISKEAKELFKGSYLYNDTVMDKISPDDFGLINYFSHGKLEGQLSTGMK